jgi:hypothetical protein
VVVVPSESAIDFSNGRRTTNPDDPDGDDHEQSAWWDPDHARKNPALRPECKASPWDKIKTASLGTEAGIFTRKPVGPDTRPPVDPADEKPMRACDGCKGCAVCGDKSVAVDTLWDHGFCPQHLHERQSGQDPIRDGGRLKPVLAGAHHVGRRHVTGEYASGDYLEDIGVDPRPNPPPKRPEPDQAANPGSTGWASGQDPPEWDGAAQNPGTMSLTSWSTLHDEPEPALPSTDGAEETEGERYRAQMRPEIDPTEDSAPSDGRTASVTDIVERFQATAGARALQQQRGSEAMDIASAARAHLEDGGIRRTALKEFSSAEQAALITEGAGGTPARNFDDLKIEGTHYADLAAALASEQSLTEAADELFS